MNDHNNNHDDVNGAYGCDYKRIIKKIVAGLKDERVFASVPEELLPAFHPSLQEALENAIIAMNGHEHRQADRARLFRMYHESEKHARMVALVRKIISAKAGESSFDQVPPEYLHSFHRLLRDKITLAMDSPDITADDQRMDRLVHINQESIAHEQEAGD